MKKKLCITGVLLFFIWAVGFFAMGLSSAIHTVLWIAAIVLIRSLFVCSDNDRVLLSKTSRNVRQDHSPL